MSTMMAAVFQGEGKLALEEVPVPRVERPDDVLLEVEAVGICGTDLHILHVPPGLRANPGIVLGHEYTGRVVQVGDAVDGCGPGDRVVVDPNVTCGRCGYCRRGDRQHVPGDLGSGCPRGRGPGPVQRCPRALIASGPRRYAA